MRKARVCNVEHGTFTPLVFSTAGGMGPIATTFYRCLASLLSDKLHQSYNQTICWLCCHLSLILLVKINDCVSKTELQDHHAVIQPATSDISLVVSIKVKLEYNIL